MKKRWISILLVLVALFTLSPVQALAASEEDILPRLQNCMEIVAASTDVLLDDLKGGELSAGPMDVVTSLKGAFTNFLGFAKTAAPAISLITGGVTFLRMIGVMKDPTQEALGHIISQLETMDQKISEINGKIDVITAQISAMQATEAFHNRGRKADTLNGYWRNFDNTYMENGLDKLMSDYDAMVRNGLQNWFENTAVNARTQGGVDNTQLVLVYVPDDKGDYQLTFSNENGLPTTLNEQDHYIVLKAGCLPQPGDITWNADTYREAFIAYVTPLMEQALQEGRDTVETNSFSAADAERLAADAVDTLVSRVACAEINKDASFATEVSRQFTNYCNHLLSSEDGLDAMFKTLYLTHAFQFQIREDLQKFCDRMMVKTGTYGAFAIHVLSMSRSMGSSSKLDVVNRFCDTVEAVDSAKSGCVVAAYDNMGKLYRYYDNYCYITNSQMYYVNASLNVEVSVDTERSDYGDGMEAYRAYRAKNVVLNPETELPDGSALLDDTNALLLFYTLKSNGIGNNYHAYFTDKENGDLVRGTGISDNGFLLTSYSGMQDLPLDGSVWLRCHLVIGNDHDYFMDYDNKDIAISSAAMPGDTEMEYMVYHKKVSGSLCDLSTGSLATGQTLLAAAAYGESHRLWYVDESALFAGPSNAPHFKSSVYTTKTRTEGDTSWYASTLTAGRDFNALFAVPVPADSLTAPSKKTSLDELKELNEELNHEKKPHGEDHKDRPEQKEEPTLQREVSSPATADGGIMLYVLSGFMSFAGLYSLCRVKRREKH